MEKQIAIDIALKFANEKYGENGKRNYVLWHPGEIIEDDEIFYIPFLEEKVENQEVWVGAYKGVIIDKTTGEIFQPGSANLLEDWIWGFKLGFRKGRVDFTITKVNDHQKTIELIAELGMQYVVPELENGTIWKIPEMYNRKEIKKRISKLPCTFVNQGLTMGLRIIQEVVNSGAFEFEVKPTDFNIESICGELIDKNNLIKKSG